MKHKSNRIMVVLALTLVSFLFSFFSCDVDATIEYEIENNLSMTIFYKVTSSGCGMDTVGRGFPNFVHDSVKPYSTKVIGRLAAGISNYPSQSEYSCIKELCIYTLDNSGDTIKSNVDYSKNQNMEYYYRNKATGVYLIRIDLTNFFPQ